MKLYRKKENKKELMELMIIHVMLILLIGMSFYKQSSDAKKFQIQKIVECTTVPSFAYPYYLGKQNMDRELGKLLYMVMPIGNYVNLKNSYEASYEDEETKKMILKYQNMDENQVDEQGRLIPKDTEQKDSSEENSGDPLESVNQDLAQNEMTAAPQLDLSRERLRDYEYLMNNFYTVDSTTMIDESQLDVDALLSQNMKMNATSEGAKLLIFHTHSQEYFVDSTEGDLNTSIVGVGEYLAQRLNEKGISTIHDSGVYDIIDGKLDRSNAYEMAEENVRTILAENPSVEVAIDLHRDGVKEETHLVTDLEGVQTAKIMFFNGLSRTRTQGDIEYLYNPYIQDNLAFSLQMQLACETYYPGFARHIYLKGYRYNLHLLPKSLLIEAGAQTNTLQEMKNAMDRLAEILYYVLSE